MAKAKTSAFLDKAGRRLLRKLISLAPNQAMHSDDVADAAGVAERTILELRNYLLGMSLIEVVTPQRDQPGSWFCRATPKGRLLVSAA